MTSNDTNNKFFGEDYEITIIGRQYLDNQHDEIKVDTLGHYMEKNHVKYITYTEYEQEAPYAGRKKVLKIEPDGVVTMLSPGHQTRMVLEKGKRHRCMYDTGAGMLSLGVFTQSMKQNLSEQGGELKIAYTLDINAHLSSKNEILVQLKKREPKDPEVKG